MRILIKGGRAIDPANNIDKNLDILIEDANIKRVSEEIDESVDKQIDARNKIVAPGLIDLHVHLREPGREDKETILSGTAAAAAGGITSVLAMANCQPAIDSPDKVKNVNKIIEKDSRINVFVSAAITFQRDGIEVTDLAKLKQQGVLAISDDGSSVEDDEVMLRAMQKAKEFDLLVVTHCENILLSNKGVVNEGFTSTKMGLRGVCRESESSRVARDIELAKKSGARLHIAHVSCRESIALIAKAKKEGIKVSAETAPHYFALNEEAVWGFDTNMKMSPPLRGKEDVLSIKQALAEGVIDIIASDHAPHTINEKAIEFDRAAFGVIGLETELAAGISELVNKKILSIGELIRKFTVNPAKILKIDRGTLSPGKIADLIIISPDKEWLVKKDEIVSKSQNSCFLGRKFFGQVNYTLCKGEVVYSRVG